MGHVVSMEVVRQTRECDGYILDLWELATPCLALRKGTSEHSLDRRTDQGGLSEDDEFEPICGDEGDIFARRDFFSVGSHLDDKSGS